MQITKMFTSWKHVALINDFIYFRSSNFLFTSCPYLERGNIFIIPMSTPLKNFASIVKINTFQNLRLFVCCCLLLAGWDFPQNRWFLWFSGRHAGVARDQNFMVLNAIFKAKVRAACIPENRLERGRQAVRDRERYSAAESRPDASRIINGGIRFM